MHPLTSARCLFHNCSSVNNNKRKKSRNFFCAFGDCGYIGHSYIMIGYLNIDNKGNVYSNSSATTPVNNARIITCVNNTPVVTAGGKREKAPERDAVTVLGARPIYQKTTEVRDVKSSRNRLLHSCYD
jgi:hypothetical protein